jgi:hypothetical protein
MVQTAEDILNGPDHFYCERHRLKMKKSLCVEWQTPGADPWVVDKSKIECKRCEQGARIAEGLGHSVEHKTVKEDIMAEKKSCRRCKTKKSLDEFDRYKQICKTCLNPKGGKRSKEPAEIVPAVVKAALPETIGPMPDNSDIYNKAAAMFISTIERKVVERIVEGLKGEDHEAGQG